MQKFLKERDINWLLHFTRVDNLESIMKHGLIPRAELVTQNIDSVFNDEYRHDECPHAVCISIEFPNYKMFYRIRLENPQVNWVVLLIESSVLYEYDCAFCKTNAGSNTVSNIPLYERKGKDALIKLFDELEFGESRESMGIISKYPTDPQAEVLVFDTIPISKIHSIFFHNYGILNRHKDLIYSQINARVLRRAFSPRDDYRFW